MHTGYHTPKTHGKLYDSWCLPDLTAKLEPSATPLSPRRNRIMNGIVQRFNTTLEKQIKEVVLGAKYVYQLGNESTLLPFDAWSVTAPPSTNSSSRVASLRVPHGVIHPAPRATIDHVSQHNKGSEQESRSSINSQETVHNASINLALGGDARIAHQELDNLGQCIGPQSREEEQHSHTLSETHHSHDVSRANGPSERPSPHLGLGDQAEPILEPQDSPRQSRKSNRNTGYDKSPETILNRPQQLPNQPPSVYSHLAATDVPEATSAYETLGPSQTPISPSQTNIRDYPHFMIQNASLSPPGLHSVTYEQSLWHALSDSSPSLTFSVSHLHLDISRGWDNRRGRTARVRVEAITREEWRQRATEDVAINVLDLTPDESVTTTRGSASSDDTLYLALAEDVVGIKFLTDGTEVV